MFDGDIREIPSPLNSSAQGDPPITPPKPVVVTIPGSGEDPRLAIAFNGIKDLPRPERNAVLSLLTRWIELPPDRRACYASAVMPELAAEEVAVLCGVCARQLRRSEEYREFKLTLRGRGEAKRSRRGKAAATPKPVVTIPGLDEDRVFAIAVDAFRNLKPSERNAVAALLMRWRRMPVVRRACFAKTVMYELSDAEVAVLCGGGIERICRSTEYRAVRRSLDDYRESKRRQWYLPDEMAD